MFIPYGNDKQLEKVIYPFPWLLKRAKWLPVMIPRTYNPFVIQAGKKVLSKEKQGLYFGISATEKDIRNASKAEIRSLFENAMKIQRLCGIEDVRFSGILEGVFYRNGFRPAEVGSKATVRMVSKAVAVVRKMSQMPKRIKIFVIGAGYIGEPLHDELKKEYTKDYIYSFEVHNQHLFQVMADSFANDPVIVIDCSGPQVLEKHYAQHMKPGFILLNEVYGSLSSLEKFANMGVSVYHIAGTDGITNPPNGHPYGKAIPGCASWSDFDDVIVKKIA